MKKQIILATLISSFSLLLFMSCEDDNDNDLLSPEEAKTEIRNTDESIATHINDMQNSKAVLTMEFFSELVNERQIDLKSFAEATIKKTPKQFFTKPGYFSSSLIKSHKADDIDPTEDTGIYEYDFDKNEFVLIENYVDYLKFIFPADQEAFNKEENNAELRIDEFIVIKDNDDEIPIKIILKLTVDEEKLVSLDYNMQLGERYHMPVSGSAELVMPPYNIEVALSGTEPDFESSMNWSIDNTTLANYYLELTVDLEKETPELIDGNMQFVPIKFDGNVHALNIEEHIEDAENGNGDIDIDYLNEQLDIEVIHTDYNQVIGHLNFSVVFEEDEPVLLITIVYQDDSWEYINEAMPEIAAIIGWNNND